MQKQLHELIDHCDELDAYARKLDGIGSLIDLLSMQLHDDTGSVPSAETVRKITGAAGDVLRDIVEDMRQLSRDINATRASLAAEALEAGIRAV